MTNEEIAKLDFQIATMKLLLTNTAMMKTMLQTQATILQALNIAGRDQLLAEIDHLLNENHYIIEQDLKLKVPETYYIKYPKN